MRPILRYEAAHVQGMNDTLARNWWSLALRGVAAILFGVFAFLLPEMTIATLVAVLAAYLLVDGVFAIVGGVRAARSEARWLPMILEGVAGVVGGIAIMLWPEASIFAVVFVVAAWAALTGLAEIMTAWRLHRTHGKWIWGIAGVLSFGFGTAMWTLPALGILTLAWGIAAYAIVFGVLELLLAFRLRRAHADHDHHGDTGYAAPAE